MHSENINSSSQLPLNLDHALASVSPEDRSENRIPVKFGLVGNWRKKPDVSRMNNVSAEKR